MRRIGWYYPCLLRRALALARRGAALCLAAALPLAGLPADGAAQAAPCPQGPAESARVADINARGELVLTDGRLVRLAGLETLGPPSDAERFTAIAAEIALWLKDRNILLRPLAAKPDRWGRIAAQVFGPVSDTPAPAAPAYINEALIAAGLLRVQPGPEPNDCLQQLYAAETEARAAAFGLWADPANAPVDTADTEALAARSGLFTLVEGRARRIGQGRFRVYIDFGQGRGDFSLTLPKRLAQRFAKAGHPLEGLAGKRLRARGVIDTRFGPQIEISGPDDIEFIEGSVDTPLTKAVDKKAGR